MGTLIVCGILGVLAVALVAWSERRSAEIATSERHLSNVRVCIIHRHAGNLWYPHEMADGRVRWYRTTHDDAVDI